MAAEISPNSNSEQAPFDSIKVAQNVDVLPSESESSARQQEGQKLLDSYSRFFEDFSGDISLKFAMGNEFKINLRDGVVTLNTEWFSNNGYDQEQIIWAVLHELSHFRDLKADDRGFEENRQQVQRKSQQIAGRIATDPSERASAEKWVGQALHIFYNVFDDIHVNGTVERRAPKYQTGTQGGKSIEDLYKDQLFKERDYTLPDSPPNHLQYLYKLLREQMVSGEEVEVGPQVKAALEQKINLLGKEYTAQEIIEKFLLPKKGSDTESSVRYQILRATLEPVFIDLLISDYKQAQQENSQAAQEEEDAGGSEANKGNEQDSQTQEGPFGDFYRQYNETSPDQFSDEEIENFAKTLKEIAEEEKKKQEEDSASPEDKAKKAQERMDQTWAEDNITEGESPEQVLKNLKDYRQVESKIAPHLRELSELWQRIIYGSRREIIRKKDGPYRQGVDLNVGEAIRQWPEIQSGQQESVRVMDKMVREEHLLKAPELIRLRILADLSGSMDAERREVLKETVVLLLSSLREFNTYLNSTRAQTRSKLTVDTEVWGFGTEAEKIKPFKTDLQGKDDQPQIVRATSDLSVNRGSTGDQEALNMILESLTPEEKLDIQNKRTMEIVFEITDGGSDIPDEAKDAVDALDKSGVIVRSFQIGDVDEEESKIFDYVWNRGRTEPFGEAVGENIESLTPAVKNVLKSYLGGIRL